MKPFFLLFLMLPGFVSLEAQSFQWAKHFGGTDHDQVYAITSDRNGNVYSVGWFRGTVDFDPGPGVYTMSSVSQEDIFLSKFDSTGNFIWAEAFSSSTYGEGRALVVDSNNNIYITGYFSSTMDADPGPGISMLSATGSTDLFILKLDSAGHLIWARQIGGIGVDGGNAILLNKQQELCLAGYFQNTVDFDPGPGQFTMAGSSPYFILKMNLAGQFLDAISFSDNGSLDIYLQSDAYDHLLVTCQLTGTRDFDPGPSVYNLSSAGSYDVAILTFNTALHLLWAKSVGGPGADLPSGIDIDSNHNVYVVGRYGMQGDYDPGPGVYTLSNSGGYDIFILRLDSLGNFNMVTHIGDINDDLVRAIRFDRENHFYITGSFKGTVDFDPGSNVYPVVPTNTQDQIFMAKYTANAELVWAAALGTGEGNALCVNSGNKVLTAGQFYFTADVDPGPGVYPLTSNGASDVYVLQLGPCGAYDTTQVQQCDSVQWLGHTYTASGYYVREFSNLDHCDSNQVLHLTITHTTTTSLVDSACDAYLFNGQTFTHTGLYHDTLLNAAGCDSVVTLALTINHPTTSTISTTACDTFLLNGVIYTSAGNYTQHLTNVHGCDSTLYLRLAMHHATTAAVQAQACKTYTLNGFTYGSSGTYVQTLTNAQGCDSVLTIHLQITNLNMTVAQSAYSLWSNSPGAQYQWVNCEGMTPIPGATNQGYSTTTGGSFAVIVTLYGCTDTSACYSVFSLGMDKPENDEAFTLFPNPSEGLVTVVCRRQINPVSVQLFNAIGMCMLKMESPSGKRFTIDLSEQLPGLYFLDICAEGRMYRMRVVRE